MEKIPLGDVCGLVNCEDLAFILNKHNDCKCITKHAFWRLAVDYENMDEWTIRVFHLNLGRFRRSISNQAWLLRENINSFCKDEYRCSRNIDYSCIQHILLHLQLLLAQFVLVYLLFHQGHYSAFSTTIGRKCICHLLFLKE